MCQNGSVTFEHCDDRSSLTLEVDVDITASRFQGNQVFVQFYGRWRAFSRTDSQVKSKKFYLMTSRHGSGFCIIDHSLQWRHNGNDGVANIQRLDYSPNRLFRRRSKKTSKLRVTGLCGIHRWPVSSPHKGPVTRKMFPFDDIIMMVPFCDVFVLWWLGNSPPWWRQDT